MRSYLPLLYLLISVSVACTSPPSSESQPPSSPEMLKTALIERLSPDLDALLDTASPVEILGSGYTWGEGPLWLAASQTLIFSDVPENIVYQWQPGDSVRPYLHPSGHTGEGQGEGANGLALDPAGQLLLCQHGDRRLARMQAPLDQPAAQYETVAATWEGKRFNSLNDLVLHSDGSIYFTDPPYGLPGGSDDPSREIPFSGVYRLNPDGEVILLIDSLSRPNGIGLSPDESVLYVANSDPKRALWMAYDLDENGLIAGGRVFADMTASVGQAHPGLPDGLKIGPEGPLFATGPGGVLIWSPDGRLLGRGRPGRATANCALGGGYLYLTAADLLLRVKLKG